MTGPFINEVVDEEAVIIRDLKDYQGQVTW